jgi:hypothetical protein
MIKLPKLPSMSLERKTALITGTLILVDGGWAAE